MAQLRTINSTTVEIADLNFKVAKDATSNAEANTGGFTVGGSNAELKYLSSGDKWTMNKTLSFADSLKTTYGDNDDLQIYHDGNHSYIEDAGTGSIKIKVGDFRVENASGNNLIKGVGDVASLHHAGSTKLATTSTGIDVTGVITTDGLTTSADINFGDNDKAKFGASDLEIYHDSTNSIIKDSGTGILRYTSSNSSTAGVVFEIENTDSTNLSGSFIHFKDSLGITPAKIGAFANELYIMRGSNNDRILTTNNGAAELYHSDDEKLTTTATGIQVTGNISNASGDLTLDVAGDIILDADGADVILKDGGTGFLEIDKDGNNARLKNPIADGDIKIQGIDGASTITALTLDMSNAGAATFNAGATIQTASNEEDALLIKQSDGTDVGSLRINNGSFSFKR